MRPVTLSRSPTNQSFTATRREADPVAAKTPSNQMTATRREADVVAARMATPLTLSKIVEAVSSAGKCYELVYFYEFFITLLTSANQSPDDILLFLWVQRSA